jgi:osmotically-inducible protein OsmY
MNRNIVFRLSFLFAFAVLLTAGCMSSRNLSTTSIEGSYPEMKYDTLQIGMQAESEAQQSSDLEGSYPEMKYDTLQTGMQAESEAQQSSDQDANITSAIKLKFANDEVLSAANIHVDTSDRSVSLMGLVMSQAIADRAVYLGRSVNGVKSVRSLLVVRSK